MGRRAVFYPPELDVNLCKSSPCFLLAPAWNNDPKRLVKQAYNSPLRSPAFLDPSRQRHLGSTSRSPSHHPWIGQAAREDPSSVFSSGHSLDIRSSPNHTRADKLSRKVVVWRPSFSLSCREADLALKWPTICLRSMAEQNPWHTGRAFSLSGHAENSHDLVNGGRRMAENAERDRMAHRGSTVRSNELFAMQGAP